MNFSLFPLPLCPLLPQHNTTQGKSSRMCCLLEMWQQQGKFRFNYCFIFKIPAPRDGNVHEHGRIERAKYMPAKHKQGFESGLGNDFCFERPIFIFLAAFPAIFAFVHPLFLNYTYEKETVSTSVHQFTQQMSTTVHSGQVSLAGDRSQMTRKLESGARCGR